MSQDSQDFFSSVFASQYIYPRIINRTEGKFTDCRNRQAYKDNLTMRKTILLGLIALISFGFTKTNDDQVIKTKKYAGIYSFGDNIEKGAVGSVIVYPETDTTILFFVEVCRGAPSYNLGQLYDRLKIEDGKGIYNSNIFGDKGCKWEITIDTEELTIKTIDGCDECGFGHAVYADHSYKRKDNLIHDYFTDGSGQKIYFNKTSPENY